MAKCALITGIGGFTGQYMAAELASHGYEVFGLDNHPTSKVNYSYADLLDVDALKTVISEVQPDVVVHLAALAFVGHGDASDFYRVNVIGTRNLLEALAFSGHSMDCVLLASSANVYGNASGGILNEAIPPSPANDYAVSKLAMEYMASLWSDRLPLVLTRPFNYTGCGQAEHFLLPKIVSHFRCKADKIELGNLDVHRDFSDVRAVVQAYRGLIESCPVGQIFNICSGRSYSLREILAICTSITGHQLKVEVNPAFVRANEVKTLTGDPSRLRAMLPGWQTTPLEETLQWMLMDGVQ